MLSKLSFTQSFSQIITVNFGASAGAPFGLYFYIGSYVRLKVSCCHGEQITAPAPHMLVFKGAQTSEGTGAEGVLSFVSDI